MGSAGASIVIAGEEFVAAEDRPFVFGRTDGDGVVGLDGNDMGISQTAGCVEHSLGVWWIVNQSTKRPLLIEHPSGPGQISLAPGERHAVTTERISVIVAGAIFSHVIEVVLPPAYTAALRGDAARLTSGTLDASAVSLSERERDALTGLCAGYLESFPRRHEHPHTYEDAARLLGGDSWTADRVRKAVERIKERFAAKEQLYFSGPHANYELATHVVTSGMITNEDLARLSARDG